MAEAPEGPEQKAASPSTDGTSSIEPPSGDQGDWGDLREEAEAALRAGRAKEALELYERHLGTEPDDELALYGHVLAIGSLEGLEAGLLANEAAIVARPDSESLLTQRGDLLRGLARWEEALDQYEKVIRIDPESSAAFFGRIEALIHTAGVEKALVASADAIEQFPDAYDVVVQRGRLFVEVGDLDVAEDMFQRTLELDEDQSDGYSGMIQVFAARRDLDRALSLADEALKRWPDSVDLLLQKAGVHVLAGQVEEALITSRRVLELDPENVVAGVLAMTAVLDLGQPEEAIELGSSLPESPDILVQQGIAYTTIGGIEEAADLYRRALAIDPGHQTAADLLRQLEPELSEEEKEEKEEQRPPEQADEKRDRRPPSARVHSDMWTLEDDLGYGLYARAIAEFIRHPSTSPPFTVSVQGPWGQGKTSVMRMIQKQLDPGHPDFADAQPDVRSPEPVLESPEPVVESPKPAVTFRELTSLLGSDEVGLAFALDIGESDHPTVWFNAWKYQSSEQIWAGLAHGILRQLSERLPDPVTRERFWLKLQLRRVDAEAVRADVHRALLEGLLPRLLWSGALVLVALVVAVLAVVGGSGTIETVLSALASGGVVLGVGAGIGGWFQAKRKSLDRALEGSFDRYVRQPDYEGRLGFRYLVEQDMIRVLELLVDPERQPLVVFIDDLDRCEPSRVGEILEAVNLFLAGDFPGTVFVLGIDAEVVAAAMEVVNAELIEQLGERSGELGWRFMDKFVQLNLLLPRLNPDQREAFLARLLTAVPKEDAVSPGIKDEADRLAAQAEAGTLDPDQAARQLGAIANDLARLDPKRASNAAARVITAGARQFDDRDPQMLTELKKHLAYLSDNPRTIKRVINLYRFHRFVSWARQTSPHGMRPATPEQIARWVIILVRWPSFIRWIQTRSPSGGGSAKDGPLELAVKAAKESEIVETWPERLKQEGITAAGWTSDRNLWAFLREEVGPDLELAKASDCGLW